MAAPPTRGAGLRAGYDTSDNCRKVNRTPASLRALRWPTLMAGLGTLPFFTYSAGGFTGTVFGDQVRAERRQGAAGCAGHPFETKGGFSWRASDRQPPPVQR